MVCKKLLAVVGNGHCGNLYFARVFFCTMLKEHTEDNVDIRLLGGGTSVGQGQVQVGFRGVWGHVCDNNWDIHDATVACRQLGYNRAVVATVASAFWSGPTQRLWLDNVRCFGEENNLKDCRHYSWGYLPSSSCGLAGVICDG